MWIRNRTDSKAGRVSRGQHAILVKTERRRCKCLWLKWSRIGGGETYYAPPVHIHTAGFDPHLGWNNGKGGWTELRRANHSQLTAESYLVLSVILSGICTLMVLSRHTAFCTMPSRWPQNSIISDNYRHLCTTVLCRRQRILGIMDYRFCRPWLYDVLGNRNVWRVYLNAVGVHN